MDRETSVVIRHETAADRDAIHSVEAAAFGQDDEARLVDALRDAGHVILSLVATDGERIVGHILFSPMTIVAGETTSPAVCLAPVAVQPEYQRSGVGSALIQAGLAELRDLGHKAVFLVGHPTYYPRFGFSPARDFDVHYQDDRDAFMAIELVAGALDEISGQAAFAPEFAAFE